MNDEQTRTLLFRGSGFYLFPLHLGRLAMVGAFCVSLPVGLGGTTLLKVRSFLGPLGLADAWGSVESAMGALPFVSSWFVRLLLVVVYMILGGWLTRYRYQHTYVDGVPLTYLGGCNPLPTLISFVLTVGTLGLALPWVLAWSKRRAYARCNTPHGPLEFTGSGLKIAWYGVITVAAFPYAFLTLGLVGVWVRLLWIRWEQNSLRVPDGEGGHLVSRFEASLFMYFRRVAKGWLFTVLTLGLYRPWALVGAWTWLASMTELVQVKDEEQAEKEEQADSDSDSEAS